MMVVHVITLRILSNDLILIYTIDFGSLELTNRESGVYELSHSYLGLYAMYY